MGDMVSIRVPELLTVREAAAVLHMHPETVRDMLRTGRLKGIKSGAGGTRSHWRIKAKQVERMIRRGADAPTEDG